MSQNNGNLGRGSKAMALRSDNKREFFENEYNTNIPFNTAILKRIIQENYFIDCQTACEEITSEEQLAEHLIFLNLEYEDKINEIANLEKSKIGSLKVPKRSSIDNGVDFVAFQRNIDTNAPKRNTPLSQLKNKTELKNKPAIRRSSYADRMDVAKSIQRHIEKLPIQSTSKTTILNVRKNRVVCPANKFPHVLRKDGPSLIRRIPTGSTKNLIKDRIKLDDFKLKAQQRFEHDQNLAKKFIKNQHELSEHLEFLKDEYNIQLDYINDIAFKRENARRNNLQEIENARKTISDAEVLQEHIEFLNNEYAADAYINEQAEIESNQILDNQSQRKQEKVLTKYKSSGNQIPRPSKEVPQRAINVKKLQKNVIIQPIEKLPIRDYMQKQKIAPKWKLKFPSRILKPRTSKKFDISEESQKMPISKSINPRTKFLREIPKRGSIPTKRILPAISNQIDLSKQPMSLKHGQSKLTSAKSQHERVTTPQIPMKLSKLKQKVKQKYLQDCAVLKQAALDQEEIKDTLEYLQDEYNETLKYIDEIPALEAKTKNDYLKERELIIKIISDEKEMRDHLEFLQREYVEKMKTINEINGVHMEDQLKKQQKPPSRKVKPMVQPQDKPRKILYRQSTTVIPKTLVKSAMTSFKQLGSPLEIEFKEVLGMKSKQQTQEMLSFARKKIQFKKKDKAKLPSGGIKNVTKRRGLEDLLTPPLESQEIDEIFKTMKLKENEIHLKKKSTEIADLMFPTDDPKLRIAGSMDPASKGVIASEIPIRFINELSSVIAERITSTVKSIAKLPSESVAKKHLKDTKIPLDKIKEKKSSGEHHECSLHLNSFQVETFFQARSSSVPNWFPGIFTVLPDDGQIVVNVKQSPSEILLRAWKLLKPTFFG